MVNHPAIDCSRRVALKMTIYSEKMTFIAIPASFAQYSLNEPKDFLPIQLETIAK